MGCSQSTSAVADQADKHGSSSDTTNTLPSDPDPSASSSEGKKKVIKDLKSQNSSVGSSFIEDDKFESDGLKYSSRHTKICQWKEELAAKGNLTEAVVHIETDSGRNIEDLYEGVHDGPILGTGVAGVVRKVKHRDTGVYFAVKCLALSLIESDEVLEALREEIFAMCKLDHPGILRLEEVYESETHIFLIQQLCCGGDLFDRLAEQSDYHYTEVGCARLVKQILSAVGYLHSKQIIHRDLKLENFLFDSKDSDELKCIDFGLSKHFKQNERIHVGVGTPYTIAPEIIKGDYNEKVDIWAVGVIAYLLLSGETPFGGIDGESIRWVRDNILQCKVEFEPAEVWGQVSDSAKKFVKRLLTANPDERPTARESQQDEWLMVYAQKNAEESSPLSSQLIRNLRNFKEYSSLHRILLEVVSFTLRPDQTLSLKADFEKINPDGEGEITLDELKAVLSTNSEAASLGLHSEAEVEGIFNSLKVQKSATTIQWHEFLAAGLSKHDFDDSNLKLAFDRLDSNRKGFIAYSDISVLLCTSNGEKDEEIKEMWIDGLKEIHCKSEDKISFEEFRAFLKGQQPFFAGRRGSRVKALSMDAQSSIFFSGGRNMDSQSSIFLSGGRK